MWLWGLFGGSIAEAVRWYTIRDELHAGLPAWANRGYWVITSIMIAIGGGLVKMYESSGIEVNSILAANIGASAPAIISTLLRGAPKIENVEP